MIEQSETQAEPSWLQNFHASKQAEKTKPARAPVKAVVINPADLRGSRWQKGMPSPNPKGRPPGIKERKAKVTEKLLDNVNGILDKMIQQALEGDSAAAALVVNRVLPVLRPQSEKVTFVLDADASISKQVEQVLAAIANGEVAPDVGKKIIEAVQSLASVRAIEDLEKRITELEAKAI